MQVCEELESVDKTSEIMTGYRKDFFDIMDELFHNAMSLNLMLSEGKDATDADWAILALYLDVASLRLQKLIKKEKRYRDLMEAESGKGLSEMRKSN